MHAITVKQPWAEAIARHGKTVENRPRRPPSHLIGQRIAIHVGRAPDVFFGWETGTAPHLATLDAWMREVARNTASSATWGVPPCAGRIIATARLVGWHDQHLGEGYWAEYDDRFFPKGLRDWEDHMMPQIAEIQTPWFTGPVGWVLADVRPLSRDVGDGGSCGSTHLAGARGLCTCGVAYVKHRPIRGNVMPFLLTPEVEAAVLAAEVQ